jgi:DNA invertase Pin-like site-specific DNA recombinase
MRKIHKIEPFVPSLPSKKRVAAYARVSVEKGRTLHSLSAQVSYYSDYIQKRPEWEYVGVYADSGETGTLKDRGEFQRLIADCEAGRIDIVITKSISRFARNTVDLLETVRRLREIGVGVRFEEQNIDSMSGDGELMMTILASFAQEEVRSLSENAKWAVKKRFENGIPNGRVKLLGYRWDGDHLVIVPEEVAVVKRIYQDFLDGKSRLTTERELEAEGITSIYGYTMRDSHLKTILTNVTYTGNLLLQKEYIADPITKKRKKNRGELPQYFVADTHEAIIDMETFQYVQDEMARRKELGALANPHIPTTVLTSVIKCGKCGRSFRRRTENSKYKVWKCATKDDKGTAVCDMKLIPEPALKAACAEVLGLDEFEDGTFAERVERITAYEGNTLVFLMRDGTETTKVWEWRSTAMTDCWTPERRAAWSKQLKARDKDGRWSAEARKKQSERMKARYAENPNWNNRRREE